MAEIVEKTAVDNLIEVIGLLTENQKVELAEKLRTTHKGHKAYSVLNCPLIDAEKLRRERSKPVEPVV